jgi:hypothetical protein
LTIRFVLTYFCFEFRSLLRFLFGQKPTYEMNRFAVWSVLALCALVVISVDAGASNSLADCEAAAAAFNNTCTGGPLTDLASHPGRSISCTGLTGTNCPGTVTGGVCVFPQKLCVTCSVVNSVTRIRVQVWFFFFFFCVPSTGRSPGIQTNSLPPRCVMTLNNFAAVAQNVDFTTNFNPAVTFASLNKNPLTKTAVPPCSPGEQS